MHHDHNGNIQQLGNTQEDVYNRVGLSSITSVLNGYNACILCYGQTGSGKTYTFFGPEDSVTEAAFANVVRYYNSKVNLCERKNL